MLTSKIERLKAETDRKLVSGSGRLDVNTVGGSRRRRTDRERFPFPIRFCAYQHKHIDTAECGPI